MGEIVNLRMHRKRSERAAREAQAAEQRARHGAPKPLREAAIRQSERAAKLLDGHALDRPKRDGGG